MNNPIIIKESFDATPERIWQAITSKEQMIRWYFDIPDFELKVGATFNFYEPSGAKKFHHRCTIKEIVPNRKLQHTWTYPEQSKGESLVTWEITPTKNRTSVKVTHAGVESFSEAGGYFNRENYVAGWKEIVGGLLRDFLAKNPK